MSMPRSAPASLALALALVACAPLAVAHEMFLKSEGYELEPGPQQVVRLLNGTFDISENSVSRDRMRDVSIVVGGNTVHPASSDWYDDEEATSSFLRYGAATPGTYVIGVSTKPSMIELSRDDFIAYLKHDGVLDTLAEVEKQGGPAKVRERYSKHVKTIVQVGKDRSADFAAVLGYPVEIVPDTNPYDLRFGQEMSFRVLVDGKPATNQLVRAGYEGFHQHDEAGGHFSHLTLRTDAEGRASFLLSNKALWYISLIYMKKSADAGVDYESRWATLSFTVK
ncbi:MAG: DUF4198 domain-containing protein [Steroidobacteraceae bacterium]|nr:DUF4198 domain-containing protein [Steroidobacteraceae bacterium]